MKPFKKLHGSHPPYNMKVKVSGDEITQRIIHNLTAIIKQLRMEMQQHIAALNFKRLGDLGSCADRTDIRAGRCQRIAATQQKV